MHSWLRTLELCSRLPIPALTATALVAAVALLAAPLPSAAVNIDWVQVGNPGNAPDTATNCFAPGCGSVGYTYYISKYDTTNAQYAEFLNAVEAGGSNRLANWLNNGQGSATTETGAYTLLGGTATPSNRLGVTANRGAITFLPSVVYGPRLPRKTPMRRSATSAAPETLSSFVRNSCATSALKLAEHRAPAGRTRAVLLESADIFRATEPLPRGRTELRTGATRTARL